MKRSCMTAPMWNGLPECRQDGVSSRPSQQGSRVLVRVVPPVVLRGREGERERMREREEKGESGNIYRTWMNHGNAWIMSASKLHLDTWTPFLYSVGRIRTSGRIGNTFGAQNVGNIALALCCRQ